jgi:hypothetical protein
MSRNGFRTTRRGLLALSGSVALAGCSALTGPPERDPVVLDGARLRSATDGPVPSVPETTPVEVAAAHVGESRRRAESLLGVAPSPLGAEDIPNGAMRQRVAAAREDARSHLQAASTANTPLAALAALRDARAEARFVATAWRYVEAGLRREDLVESAAAVRADVRAFRDRRSYVGDDPVSAALSHETVTTLLDAAERHASVDASPPSGRSGSPLTLGAAGRDLERAGAAREDAAHLYDSFVESLSRPRDLGTTLSAAADSLATAVTEGAADLPPAGTDPADLVEADVAEAPAGYALWDLHDGALPGEEFETARSADRHARVVCLTHRALASQVAFSALRERVRDGERFTPESAADVATLREGATTAIGTALAESDRPALAREVLSTVAALVRYADRELEDAGEEVELGGLARDLAEYVGAAALARAVPAADRQVVDALRSGRG